VKYYSHIVASSIDQPVPTVTTKGRFGLVVPEAKPFIVPQFGERPGQEPRVHDIDKPTPAVTSHGAGAIVSPFLVEVNHGGQDDRVRSVESPLGTVTTKRGTAVIVEAVAEPMVDGVEVDPRRLIDVDGTVYLLDIRFRMLSNLQLARAMGFTDSESTYEFMGNLGEVTKQIGNAVPVNLAAALVKAILQ